MIAAALAVELMASVLQHPLKLVLCDTIMCIHIFEVCNFCKLTILQFYFYCKA